MSQPIQSTEDISRYATLPVTVIAEPLPALRVKDHLKPDELKSCEVASSVLPIVNDKKQLIALRQRKTKLGLARLSEWDGAYPLEEHPADEPDAFEALTPDIFFKDELSLDFPKLPDTAPISQAQVMFGLGQWSHIPLVDAQGRYTGLSASRKRLHDLLAGCARPVRMGGLATPLGVYMTSGLYASGAGWKGLIATGLLFAVLAHVLDYWILLLSSALIAVFPVIGHFSPGMHSLLETSLALCSFLVLIRLLPISGLHAAEHMTINAIENDLPLLPLYVRSQPREHRRCGTNLMVLIGGIELIALFLYGSWPELNPLGKLLYVILGLILVFNYWQPVGLWLQRHFTTKDPTDAQLASGLKAGRELLEHYQACPHPYPTLWQRILGSGLIHMAVTFLLGVWLIGWLLEVLLSGKV